MAAKLGGDEQQLVASCHKHTLIALGGGGGMSLYLRAIDCQNWQPSKGLVAISHTPSLTICQSSVSDSVNLSHQTKYIYIYIKSTLSEVSW